MYVIYHITNKINNKIYIGLTKDFKQRMTDHKNYALTKKYDNCLYKAIRKYGFDNFEWQIIENNIENRTLAQEKECYYINLYKSNKSNIGYNMTTGGDGLDSSNKETINKIKQSVINYYHSEKFDRYKHSRKPFYVFKTTGEYIGKWYTQKDCCEELNLLTSKVNLCLNKRNKQHKGYYFSYDKIPPTKTQILSKKNHPITVYDRDNNYIGKWNSIRKFCKEFHISALTARKIIKDGYYKNYPYKIIKD